MSLTPILIHPSKRNPNQSKWKDALIVFVIGPISIMAILMGLIVIIAYTSKVIT